MYVHKKAQKHTVSVLRAYLLTGEQAKVETTLISYFPFLLSYLRIRHTLLRGPALVGI